MLVCISIIHVLFSLYTTPDIVYEIHATLDTDVQTLTGIEKITYHHDRVVPVSSLYFSVNEYITILNIQEDSENIECTRTGPIVAVQLDTTLYKGDSVSLTLDYSLSIPPHNGIFGYVPCHYEMLQWYPALQVYSDNKSEEGEESQPGSDYDIVIDVPDEYIVIAPGTQIDPDEKKFMETYISSGRKLSKGSRKTVHYKVHDLEDFVWVCDPYMLVQHVAIDSMELFFFYRPYDRATWDNTVLYVTDAITRYNEWFAHYPYSFMNIIQGLSQQVIHPQMFFVNGIDDELTRLYETKVVTDLSGYWFDRKMNIAQESEQWFIQGFKTYAAVRYLEDKYGKNVSLIRSSFLPTVSPRYIHQVYYYLTQTNGLEKPVTTIDFDTDDITLTYPTCVNSKPALFLFSLENIAGDSTFQEILHEFMEQYRFRSALATEFFNIYETHTGLDIEDLSALYMYSTEYCDWAVSKIGEHTTVIKNHGGLLIPVSVLVETEHDEYLYFLDGKEMKRELVVPEGSGEIVAVSIDTSASIMDVNMWNNYYPRRFRMRLITQFELPSFDTYDMYLLPYPWYDGYDGVTANLYWFGDRFADFDVVKGGHQFMGGVNHGFKSHRTYVSANYQTPLLFDRGLRIRLGLNASHSRRGEELGVSLVSGIGRPFSSTPQITITNHLVYNEISSFGGIDSMDWSLGTNIALLNGIEVSHGGWSINIGLSGALHSAGSDWEYLKTTFEIQRSITLLMPIKARFFAGRIVGDAPLHEQLFLSGDLRINWLADLIFSQAGSLSPQEHIHVPGDGNMRGYQTLHIKHDKLYALNFEFPERSPVRVFTDIGYYDDLAFDVGLCAVLSTDMISSLPIDGVGIRFNAPLYTYSDFSWRFRWSIGISM